MVLSDIFPLTNSCKYTHQTCGHKNHIRVQTTTTTKYRNQDEIGHYVRLIRTAKKHVHRQIQIARAKSKSYLHIQIAKANANANAHPNCQIQMQMHTHDILNAFSLSLSPALLCLASQAIHIFIYCTHRHQQCCCLLSLGTTETRRSNAVLRGLSTPCLGQRFYPVCDFSLCVLDASHHGLLLARMVESPVPG